jgi:hypothetical protein
MLGEEVEKRDQYRWVKGKMRWFIPYFWDGVVWGPGRGGGRRGGSFNLAEGFLVDASMGARFTAIGLGQGDHGHPHLSPLHHHPHLNLSC